MQANIISLYYFDKPEQGELRCLGIAMNLPADVDDDLVREEFQKMQSE